MARERLTSRGRQSADDKTPYPGSINQEGRAENERGSMTYRTFEPSVENHEGVDYGDVHGNDEHRNEMNIGIPDPASKTLITASEDEADYQRKCLKAAQAAELMLGERVSDRVLLAQARDFLALDEETLDRTIERFNRTEQFYAAEGKEEAKEEKLEDKGPAPVVPAEPSVPTPAIPAAPVAPVVTPTVASKKDVCEKCKEEKCKCAAEAPKAEEKKEEKAEEKKEMPPVDADGKFCKASKARTLNIARLAARTLPVNECNRENIVKQSAKFASLSDDQVALALIACGEQPMVDEKAAEPVKAAKEEKVEEKVEEDVAAPAPVASVNESDFDLSGEFNDGPVAADAQADAELASLFSDPMIDSMYASQPQEENMIVAAAQEMSGERKRTASKVGVKSIGASVSAPSNQATEGSADLGSLWKDAPDVNDFFRG
jgi:hypothetical protein